MRKMLTLPSAQRLLLLATLLAVVGRARAWCGRNDEGDCYIMIRTGGDALAGQSLARGVRFTPGGIRKGAAGYDVCFIHPKGNEESPIGGEGVLIELVQAPADVIAALG